MLALRWLGFESGKIREVVATFYAGKRPNATTLGIKWIDDTFLETLVYEGSDLFEYDPSELVINVVGARELVRSALRGWGREDIEFPEKMFLRSSRVRAPFLAEAQAYMDCIVEKKEEVCLKNELGESRARRIVMRILRIVEMKPMIKAFSRGESLAVEAAVLATRLALAAGSKRDEIRKKFISKILEAERLGVPRDILEDLEEFSREVLGIDIRDRTP